jgi:tRNA (cmo5U34)-methyltransferase
MKTFDFDTIEDFDTHIALSIPNYDFLAEHVLYLIEALTEGDSAVVDLGCSTGKMLKTIDRREDCQYFGYDISSLLPKGNDKINLFFEQRDIVKDAFKQGCSVISAVFTLQFLPRHQRQLVIDKAYKALNAGGYFIVVEKTHSATPLIENLTNAIYYRYKQKNFSSEAILEKQQSLASVMKLHTSEEIMQELSAFTAVEIFWKSYGFTGYIARK